MIGWIGAIIGGVCTIAGVFISNWFQRRRDVEQHRLQVMPLFTYEVSGAPESFDNSAGQLAGEGG